MDIMQYVTSMNWQMIAAIFAVNWWFYRELKGDMRKMEEQMFYLATGRTLQQAILDEKIKE